MALDGRALSGTTGAVLDPVLSLRRRVRIAPGGHVRLAFATGVAASRAAALALAEKYDDPSVGRPHLRARLPPRPRARCATSASRPTRRSSTSGSPRACCGPTARCARRPTSSRATRSASRPLGPRHLRRPADPARARGRGGRSSAGAPGAAGAGVLAAQGPQRRRRDPQRASGELPRRDARAARGAARDGPWAAWKHRPGGVFLLRGDGMPEAERVLLAGRARAVLSGERGELADQLDLPYPEPQWQRELPAPPPAPVPERRRQPTIEAPPLDPRQRPRRLHRRAGASTPSCSTATRTRRCPG